MDTQTERPMACWGCGTGEATIRCAITAHTLCPACADQRGLGRALRLPLDADGDAARRARQLHRQGRATGR